MLPRRHLLCQFKLFLICSGVLLPFAAFAQIIFSDSFEDVNDKSAARFLDQASFGGRLQDIALVRQFGYAGWLDQQFNAAVSLQKPYLDWVTGGVYQQQRQEAWFIHSAQLSDPSNPLLTHDLKLFTTTPAISSCWSQRPVWIRMRQAWQVGSALAQVASPIFSRILGCIRVGIWGLWFECGLW